MTTQHPDEDALVTTLDGRQLDVQIDLVQETVMLTGEGFSLMLSPRGAIEYAEQINAAAKVVLGDHDVEDI